MSDVGQGPGWWLASDGKWYPPQAQPGAGGPPLPVAPVTNFTAHRPAAPAGQPAPVPGAAPYVAKPSGGNGCLKAVAIVGGIFVVVIIGIAVLIAVAANRVKTKVDAGLANSANSAHPPVRDLQLTSCQASDSGNPPHAGGTLTNHSSKASHYIITVEFDQGTTRVGGGTAVQDALAPGSTTDWSAKSDSEATGPVTCKVVSVNRFAAQR